MTLKLPPLPEPHPEDIAGNLAYKEPEAVATLIAGGWVWDGDQWVLPKPVSGWSGPCNQCGGNGGHHAGCIGHQPSEPWREGVALLVEAWDRYWSGGRYEADAVAFVKVVEKSRAMLKEEER